MTSSSIGESLLAKSCEYRVIAWLKEHNIDEDRPLMPRDIAPVIVAFAKEYYADALRLIEEYERLRVLDYNTRNQPIIFPR